MTIVEFIAIYPIRFHRSTAPQLLRTIQCACCKSGPLLGGTTYYKWLASINPQSNSGYLCAEHDQEAMMGKMLGYKSASNWISGAVKHNIYCHICSKHIPGAAFEFRHTARIHDNLYLCRGCYGDHTGNRV